MQLRILDISSLDCGLAGLRELHARGVTQRLDELYISGSVGQFGGPAEGLQHDVLDVLAATLDCPKSRLSKIVFEVGQSGLLLRCIEVSSNCGG